MEIKSGIMWFKANKYVLSRQDHVPGHCLISARLIEKYLSNYLSSAETRHYCSGVDGRGNAHDACAKDVLRGNKSNESTSESTSRVIEQDQTEGLRTENLSSEYEKIKKSPFWTRVERFRDEFCRRVVPWENMIDSWKNFPYDIHGNTKNDLLECMAAQLKHNKFIKDYGGRLAFSRGRILLQSIPGTALYRERLVRALARELQVAVLMLDSRLSPPYGLCEESEDVSEDEDENDSSDDEECSSSESDDSDDEVDNRTSDEKNKKSGSTKSKCSSSSSKSKTKCLLKKGDRVKYIGPIISSTENNRTLSSGQRGEIDEINGDQVDVIFYNRCMTKNEGDEKSSKSALKASVYKLPVKDIKQDQDAQTHDCYVAMQVLCEVVESREPIVVYFPDSSLWLSRSVPKSTREEYLRQVQEMFDQLSGRVVLICAQNKRDFELESMDNFPCSLARLIRTLKATKRCTDDAIDELFTNVISIKAPKEQDKLETLYKQIETDRRTLISQSNLSQMREVLREHNLLCTGLEHVNTVGLILTKRKAEEIIGKARNHHLSSCIIPHVKEDHLNVPQDSIRTALLRLKEVETKPEKPSKSPKCLAEDEFETNFVSAVVRPEEIGVKFDDVGAHEDVKKALNELVILPMKRPELFSRGNLRRPCKGLLLFGPPGTGKTLLAKALATESGANFINVTAAGLLSMWHGEDEKLVRALFSFAGKLAPAIVFIDEIDSLMSARGSYLETGYARKLQNEFMSAWDGLSTRENDRILILGATNRPFDLDDAVIRRMPRRIYVDLPDVENRSKILKVILAQENLEPGFSFQELAEATQGYSGSDLKNLCVAAAYRPVQELLEEESKGHGSGGVPVLRPLKLDDFIHSKAKVGQSVVSDSESVMKMKEWNEQYNGGGSGIRKWPIGF